VRRYKRGVLSARIEWPLYVLGMTDQRYALIIIP
jgi:hypothetical protein